MKLLEIYKKNREKEQEYKNIEKNREFDYEFKKLISAIIEGKEYILTNNERLFAELGIKHRKEKQIDFTLHGMREGYKLKITEKVVEKVEEYMNK